MKKKYYLLSGLCLSLFMISCADEPGVVTPPVDPVLELTFEFPNAKNFGTTYADPIATESENELRTLDVYVFREDELSTATPKPMILEDIHQSGVGISLTTMGDNKKTTLTLAKGERKYFYFVGNGRSHLTPKDVILDQTTAVDFEKKVSAALEGHIKAPLLMTGFVEVPKVSDLITGGAKHEVKLTRRVVRFDVFNNAESSDFIIEKILITDARSGVNLFEIDGSLWPSKDNPQRPIDAHEAPLIAKMPQIDFLPYENANHGLSNGVFYLYPTFAAGETKIELVGKDLATGNPQVYPVHLRTKQDDESTKFNIKANTRYVLNILSKGIGYLNATLEAEDWKYDPDNDIPVSASYGIIKLFKDDDTPIDNNNNTIELQAENTIDAKTLIKVGAESEWEAIVPDEYKDWLSTDQDQLDADVINTEFQLWTIEGNPSSTQPREGIVEIRNKNRPSIVQPLLIRQEPNTTRHINFSGSAVNEGRVVLMGEKTSPVTINIEVPDGRSWTAEASENWLTLTATKATAAVVGSGKLTMTPEANPNQDTPRDGFITVTMAKDGAETDDLVLRIPVRQMLANLGGITVSGAGVKEVNNVLTLTANPYGFPDTDGKRIIRVYAHTAWTVDCPESWVTISDVSLENGSHNGSFKVFVDESSETAERTATITITNTTDSSIKQEITLKQTAPTVTRPVVKDFDLTGATAANWTEAERTYDFSDNQAAAIKFKVEAGEAPYYTIVTKYDETGKSVGLDNHNSKAYRDLIVVDTNTAPAEGSSDPHQQEVTINVPTQAADYQIPIDIIIYVRNNTNHNYYTTITLKSRPDYNGLAGLKPVLVGGKFWAPVNVGQTTLDGSDAASLASWGYYYQYARNNPFNPETHDNSTDVVEGPLSYEDSMNEDNKGKFIKTTTAPYDWLIVDDPHTNERNNTWTSSAMTPCPKGWKMPTRSEAGLLDKTTVELENERVKYNGDEAGVYLYFPYGRTMSQSSSSFSTKDNSAGRMWTQEGLEARYQVINLRYSITTPSKAAGFPIRCIQE